MWLHTYVGSLARPAEGSAIDRNSIETIERRRFFSIVAVEWTWRAEQATKHETFPSCRRHQNDLNTAERPMTASLRFHLDV